MGFLESLPIIGGLFDDSDEKAMEIYKSIPAMYEGIPQADINYREYRPGQIEYTGDYTPEQVRLQQISEDPKVRADILQNLSRMQYLADKGLSAEDELGMEKARSEAEQMARGREQAVIQNLQARGQGGAGMEAALRAQAAQESANRARQGAMEQAAQTARQKALYTQAYGNALSQFRGDEFGQNAQNAGIANQQALTNVNARNQAKLRNLGARQDVATMNLQAQNQAQLRNIDAQNAIAQQKMQNAYTEANAKAGAQEGIAQGYLGTAAKNAATRGAIGSALATGIGALATGGLSLAPQAAMGAAKKLTGEGYGSGGMFA